MKPQILALLGVFTFVMLATGLVSAATNFSLSTDSLVFSDDSPQTIAITNTTPVTIDVDPTTVTVEGIVFTITFDDTEINVTPEEFDINDFDFNQEYTGSFNVSDGTETEEVTITIANDDYCEYDEGSLELTIDEINVKEGFGDDEDYWYPFDVIEVDVIVENHNNDEKIKDIEVEWALYASNGDKVMDGDESKIDLGDGDDDTVTIKITLDDNVDDLEDDTYTLYVRATGDEQDDDDEFSVCSSDSQKVDIVIQDDFVLVSNIEINGNTVGDDDIVVSCGEELIISADVWNIGSDDQDDVTIHIYNQDLEISKQIEFDEIESLDNDDFEVTLMLPEDVEEGFYWLKFTTYDEDDDPYETDEEEDKSEVVVPIKVEGSCVVIPTASVLASLESGGKAGKEMVVKAVITNTGEELATYSVNAAGYAGWASNAELDQSTLVLTAGESADVLITFDVNKGIEGEKTFNVEVVSDNEVVTTQPVSVTIEKGFSLGSITGNVISDGNWYLWGIGALNVILVIIIILVAVRIVRG